MKKLFYPVFGLICWVVAAYYGYKNDYQQAIYYLVLATYGTIMAKLEEKDD